MSSPDPADPGVLHNDAPDAGEENLFGKLDQLISKHQGRIQRQPSNTQIPVLTEPVQAGVTTADLAIPVLQEVVASPAPGTRDPASEIRRKLQIALYLRLRQRLDDELQVALAAQGALAGTISDAALTRLVNALRSALPTIVGESVDQVLAADAAATRAQPGRGGP
jgi:hypothetical protein